MKILLIITLMLGQGLPIGGSFILERGPKMAYDIGVRSYLTGKGVPNASIDYDKNSGNVTINKQPFYKPELNMSGSTYSNQANLDNAYKTYSAAQAQPTQQGNVIPGAMAGASMGMPKPQTVSAPSTGMSSISTNVPSNATGFKNPYVSQYEDIMKRLDESNKAMQQPTDIYNSPEYAAAKAMQDKSAHQSTRAAQESMGASGFGRSTNLADRAQGIQNEANDYLQTQLVPQIQSALQNKNQQQYNNLLSQFNTIYQLVNQADNQHQNEVANANNDRTFEAGRQDAATAATGIYNPSGLSYEEVKAQMDRNSKAYGTATPEEQARLHDENIQLGSQLGQTYDSKTGTYSKDQGFVGTKTMDAKTAELSNIGQEQQNLLNQYKIDDYPAEQKANATKVQQDLATGKLTLEAAKYNFEQLKDPNSTINQANKIDLQLKQLDLKNAPEKARLELVQLQKQIAEIGKVHTQPQSAADQAADQVKLATANKQLEDIKKGIYPGDKSSQPPKVITAEEYQSNLKPQYDNHGKVTNIQQIEDQIILSGMSDWEQYKSYKANGIPWDDPIPQKPS